MAKSIMEQLKQGKQQTATSTADELAKNASEIEKTQTEIRQGENRIKILEQAAKKETHKARTRRLIERGAILEKAINDADKLTNEQIQTLVYTAFSTPAIAEKLKDLRKQAPAE